MDQMKCYEVVPTTSASTPSRISPSTPSSTPAGATSSSPSQALWGARSGIVPLLPLLPTATNGTETS